MPADAASFCPWIHVAGDGQRFHRWKSPLRELTHWLAVVSDQGSERIVVDGTAYDIASGASYLIQPGSQAELSSVVGNRPVWVHFDLAHDPRRTAHPQVHTYAPEAGARRAWLQPRASAVLGVDLPVVVPKALQARFRSGLPDVVRRWQHGDPLAVRRAAHDLGAMILAVAEHLSGDAQIAMPDGQRLDRAEAAVRAGLSAGAGLDVMAAAAGLGRSRFCELYTRERGVSPGAFVRAERLARASELLATSALGIGEIAQEVGFADATVFGRFFRAATGATPSAWRQSGRDGDLLRR